jgi:GDP-L-fucose synthase
VDDAADAIVFSAEHYSDVLPLNIGYGSDISIRELVNQICEVVGYDGEVLFDTSMPDGTPSKLMDSSRINALGWQARTKLAEGLASTYAWYLKTRQQN